MLWLKFNIYSLLLTFIGLMILSLSLLLVKYFSWWVVLIAFVVSTPFFSKAAMIFQRYSYKVETFHIIVAKLRKKYDLRYCQPYMSTACMRCVIYFALREIGKQKDYVLLKRRKIENNEPHGNLRVVSVKSLDGRLVFTSQDIMTGEIEEI